MLAFVSYFLKYGGKFTLLFLFDYLFEVIFKWTLVLCLFDLLSFLFSLFAVLVGPKGGYLHLVEISVSALVFFSIVKIFFWMQGFVESDYSHLYVYIWVVDKMMKGKPNTAHCLRFPGDWYGLHLPSFGYFYCFLYCYCLAGQTLSWSMTESEKTHF